MDTVPYQPGMTLGRTFDFKYMRPGIDIFTEEALAKSKIIDNHQTSITYSVVENNKDKKEALGVDGAMSLKVKAGICKVKGIGEYLNTDRSKENTIEILARAHVETMTETMTVTIPTTGWQKNVTGSHYIRSVTYGGDMIVSIRIQGSSKDHFNEIKAKVDAGLQTGGLIDVEAKGQFKKLEEELRSGSKISINYFSTTLQGMMPRDINGMLKALDNFNDQVIKSNEGRGVPLTCELLPLSLLDSSVPHVLKNKALEVQLTQLDDYYEDVLQAKATMVNALEKDDVDLTTDQEENALQLEECIDEMLTVFNKVIVHLDITSNSDSKESSQTTPAFEVYKKYKKKPGSYTREVARFVKSLQSVQSPDASKPTELDQKMSDGTPDSQAKIREAERSLSTREEVQSNFDIAMQPYGNVQDLISPAPLSIALLGQLILLSLERDLSLISKDDPSPQYLTHPGSLRASLLQVSHAGWEAFNLAHKNMDAISLKTGNVPTYVNDSVKIIIAGTVDEMEVTLPKCLKNIKRIATDCIKKAQDVECKFVDVMQVIQEFLKYCIAKQRDHASKTLIQGITVMGKVREQCSKLLQYFQMMSNIVECTLQESLNGFLESAESGQELRMKKGGQYSLSKAMRDIIYLQASKANQIAFLVLGLSGTYVEVSDKYILRPLTGLDSMMALDADKDKREIKEFQRTLQRGAEDAVEAINQLVEQRHDEIMEKGYERIIKYEKTMREALPPPSAEEEKGLQAIIEAAAKPLSKPSVDIGGW